MGLSLSLYRIGLPLPLPLPSHKDSNPFESRVVDRSFRIARRPGVTVPSMEFKRLDRQALDPMMLTRKLEGLGI